MNNAGEPAFPSHYDKDEICYDGLTKREFFAAKAMQGMLANDKFVDFVNDDYPLPRTPEIVREAYELADAMLAPKEKELILKLLSWGPNLNGMQFSEESIKKMQAKPPEIIFKHNSDALYLNGEEVEFAPQMVGDQLVGVSIVPKSAITGGKS